jgi:hypothetical protein
MYLFLRRYECCQDPKCKGFSWSGDEANATEKDSGTGFLINSTGPDAKWKDNSKFDSFILRKRPAVTTLNVTLALSELAQAGVYNSSIAHARDLFQEEDLGMLTGGAITLAVGYHDVKMLRLSPA